MPFISTLNNNNIVNDWNVWNDNVYNEWDGGVSSNEWGESQRIGKLSESCDDFVPRFRRVNLEECKMFLSPFRICNYSYEKSTIWLNEEEIKRKEIYWKYIKHCENIRGIDATACREINGIGYVEPFKKQHYINWLYYHNELKGR